MSCTATGESPHAFLKKSGKNLMVMPEPRAKRRQRRGHSETLRGARGALIAIILRAALTAAAVKEKAAARTAPSDEKGGGLVMVVAVAAADY